MSRISFRVSMGLNFGMLIPFSNDTLFGGSLTGVEVFDRAHRHCVSDTLQNVNFLEPIIVGAVSTRQKAHHMTQKVHIHNFDVAVVCRPQTSLVEGLLEMTRSQSR